MSSANAASSSTAASKPSPTANTKPNRLPAPTLFVGPPSRNASQLSIPRPAAHEPKLSRDPLHRQKSALSRPYNADQPAPTGGDADSPQDSIRPPALTKASEKRVEAKWKELQSTLNEVELTAQSSTHVFGESHSAALDVLREAQVELARAWGRGNEKKPTGVENDLELNVNRFKGAEDLALDRQKMRARADTNASASTALSDESGRSDSTSHAAGARGRLEDETAQDIQLASERRAANEAYFHTVDRGVRDVVAKLEAVAEAMRGVEGESRSLWSSSDGLSTSLEEERSVSRPGTRSGDDTRQERKDGRSG